MPVAPHSSFRNWSHKVVPMLLADALAVSVPKSGRTWLRVFLQHYFCAQAGVPLSLSPVGGRPAVHFCHDLWHHLTTPRHLDRILGVHLIPSRLRRRKKIILVMRDPRDVVVSLHLHLTRRGFKTGASFAGSLSELLRDPTFGIRRVVSIQNAWLREWREGDGCLIWRYEHCRENPEDAFGSVLRFLDRRPVDIGLLRESIAFADFGNMQRMEREHRFDRPMLKPGDPADPESFKVRRGVVGGYRDYLSPVDAGYVQQIANRSSLRGWRRPTPLRERNAPGARWCGPVRR